eukprot:SAG11_NODE_5160_length_1643_cov_5.228627_3_plen_220_part_00
MTRPVLSLVYLALPVAPTARGTEVTARTESIDGEPSEPSFVDDPFDLLGCIGYKMSFADEQPGDDYAHDFEWITDALLDHRLVKHDFWEARAEPWSDDLHAAFAQAAIGDPSRLCHLLHCNNRERRLMHTVVDGENVEGSGRMLAMLTQYNHAGAIGLASQLGRRLSHSLLARGEAPDFSMFLLVPKGMMESRTVPMCASTVGALSGLVSARTSHHCCS